MSASVKKKRLPSSKASKAKDTVGVYLRLRPLKLDEPTLVRIGDQQVKTTPPDGSQNQIYSFTHVFDNAPQSEIFDKVARPIVEQFITSGKDGLIFTYGITGSGKTYTMEGLKSDPGLIYRTIDFIFNSIGVQQTKKNLIENNGSNIYYIQDSYDQQQDVRSMYPSLARAETMSSAIPSVVKWKNRTKEKAMVNTDPTAYYCLFMSLIELYNKQVHDLLEDMDPRDLDAKEKQKRREIRTDRNGHSYVANAVELEVKSADEAVEIYTRGVRRRKTGSTALNQESSRGHCVLNLRLVQIHKSFDGQFNEDTLVASQLCLVDLAGSERAKRSGATGGVLQEACNINNSLGALRKCIRALREGEPTANIQYREYNLTRLFKSYFEGHGSVRMVLCVKPTQEDFLENNIAMEFGLLTQEIPTDYASPPKMLKRTKSQRTQNNPLAVGTLYEKSDKKFTCPDFEDFDKFVKYWHSWMSTRRVGKEKTIDALLKSKSDFRQNLERKMKDTATLREQYENYEKESQDEISSLKKHIEKLDHLNTVTKQQSHETKIKNHELKVQNHNLLEKYSKVKEEAIRLSKKDQLLQEAITTIKARESKSDRIKHLLREIESNVIPSAPDELEPLQSSSPVDFPSSDLTGSNTPPTTTNSSTDNIEYNNHHNHHLHNDHNHHHDEHHHHHHDHDHQTEHRHQYHTRNAVSQKFSPTKTVLTSPTHGGIPVVNPRHNRSLSCSSMQWIHHRPQGTIETGTVLKPKFKNGKSVKNLRSSDILRKDAGGYSVVHQGTFSNGDVETSVYKGQIISTVCGGAQVILNDIETMRQVSPEKKRRAVSDAHFTH